MKILWLCLVIVLLVSRSAAAAFSDEEIARAVESRIEVRPAGPERVSVDSRNGIVTLQGTVDNLLAKEHAERSAEATRGVRAVINRIRVQAPRRSDQDIAGDVKSALAQDPVTERHEIKVDVEDREATLAGVVSSWQEKKAAGDIAKGIEGLVEVHNKIAVHYDSARPDAEVAADIERRLRSDMLVNARGIAVKIRDGNVSLTGAVGSAAEKARAISDAWVAGTKSVDAEELVVDPQLRERANQPRFVYRTDGEIRKTIAEALAYDPRVRRNAIDVQVLNGEAILRGTVASLAAKQAAEENAENTAGVWLVRNHLEVRAGEEIPDEEIRRRIIEALEKDAWLEANDITVRVFNKKAYLSGSVDSRAERERAARLVAAVKGVAALQNNLNPPVLRQLKSDRQIQRDIEARLQWSARVDDPVEVDVRDGVATLSGTVDDFAEWRAAASNALEAGARGVINRLNVRFGPPSLRG